MPGSSVQHCRNMHMGKQEQCYGTEDGERACQVAGVDEGFGVGDVNERRMM